MRRPAPLRSLPALALVLAAAPVPVPADPFTERPIALPWTDSRDAAVGDFNGDGRPDIAALNSYGPHHFECYPPPGGISCGDERMLLTVALNEGLGTFAPVRTTPAMCAPWHIVAGDFNADGRDDLIVGNRGARDAFGICSQASVSFYPGDGAGGFFTSQHVMVPDEPAGMAAGDFNGDGVPEAAVVFGSPGRLQLFGVGQNGVFTSGAQWYAPGPLAAIAAGDLDGDLDDEMVVAYSSTPQVALLDLGAAFVVMETCTLDPGVPAPRSVLVGDLAPDLVPDIAIGRPAGTGALVTLLRRGPTGSYCAGSTTVDSAVGAGYGRRLAAADLNADGIPDLAATDGAWHLQSLIGDGAGGFAPSAPIATSGATDRVVAADLNGDWVDDLVVAGPQVFLPTGAVLALINETPIAALMGLVMAGDDLDWNAVFDAVGYDLVRGDLGALRAGGGDFSAAVEACVADDVVPTGLRMTADPPPGVAWWVIGRPVLAGGPGTYDAWGPGQAGGRDAGIGAAAAACP